MIECPKCHHHVAVRRIAENEVSHRIWEPMVGPLSEALDGHVLGGRTSCAMCDTIYTPPKLTPLSNEEIIARIQGGTI
jgi:hypothetical protein